jgi:hypothetical protein
MKKHILGLLAVCLVIGLGALSFAQESTYEVANEVNKTLPRRINRELVMTSVNPRSDTELAFVITNVIHPASHINFNQIYNQAYNWSRNSLCSQYYTRELIKRGYTFTYSYYGMNGVHIGEISIDSCPQ